MQNRSLATLIAWLAVLLALLHLAAIRFNLYYSIIWFDVVVHFVGGVFAGLWALQIFLYRNIGDTMAPSRTKIFLTAILGSLLLGLFWEIFEWSTGLIFTAKSTYAFDTVLDFVADVAGGIAAAVYMFQGNAQQKRNE